MSIKNGLSLYFGDSRDNIFPKDYQSLPVGVDLLAMQPYAKLAQGMGLEKLFFLRQVHGTAGVTLKKLVSKMAVQEVEQKNSLQGAEPSSLEHECVVQNTSSFTAFSCEGDYLITNEPRVGIGIMTADCLPLVLHDPVTQSIAAIHAGWRGAVAGIATIALARMRTEFGAQPENVLAYLGPCIHQCCYQVGEQVSNALEAFYGQASLDAKKASIAQVLALRQGACYFNLPGFVAQQLESAGLKKEAIFLENSLCTHCNPDFWSYRRQAEKAGRQMTVISLDL